MWKRARKEQEFSFLPLEDVFVSFSVQGFD